MARPRSRPRPRPRRVGVVLLHHDDLLRARRRRRRARGPLAARDLDGFFGAPAARRRVPARGPRVPVAAAVGARARPERDDRRGSAAAYRPFLDDGRGRAEVHAPVYDPQQHDEAGDGPQHDADDGAWIRTAGRPAVALRHRADVGREPREEVRGAGGEVVEFLRKCRRCRGQHWWRRRVGEGVARKGAPGYWGWHRLIRYWVEFNYKSSASYGRICVILGCSSAPLQSVVVGVVVILCSCSYSAN